MIEVGECEYNEEGDCFCYFADGGPYLPHQVNDPNAFQYLYEPLNDGTVETHHIERSPKLETFLKRLRGEFGAFVAVERPVCSDPYIVIEALGFSDEADRAAFELSFVRLP